MGVEELYKQQIMQHYRHPLNQGILDNADIDFYEVNPLCGDEIHLTMQLQDDVVKDVRFSGKGCAISLSAASLMTENFKGKSLDKLKQLKQEDVLNALGIHVGPGRIKCVTLILKALQRGIYLHERKAEHA